MSVPREVFQCRACGQCCHGEGGIGVTPAESSSLAAFLGLSVTEFEERFTRLRHGRREVRVDATGACMFLQGDLCGVHRVKPSVCRAWPWLPAALGDPWGFEGLKDYCPGMDPDASWEDFRAAAPGAKNGHGGQPG